MPKPKVPMDHAQLRTMTIEGLKKRIASLRKSMAVYSKSDQAYKTYADMVETLEAELKGMGE